jgi:diadenosine tetraphosphate (Ap4A) HIT family hydrolase
LGGNPFAGKFCVVMTDFALDPRLQGDTIKIAHLSLCDLLLMNDARYPWAILVPRIAGARELHDLGPADQDEIWKIILAVSAALGAWPSVEKVNVGALGNVVSQLHVHIVGRHSGDPAWPGPVWGHSPRVAYADGAQQDLVDALALATNAFA